MIKMISPTGKEVEVLERKSQRFLDNGYTMPGQTKPEPEEVQEEDSHEEIEHNEEEA